MEGFPELWDQGANSMAPVGTSGNDAKGIRIVGNSVKHLTTTGLSSNSFELFQLNKGVRN